MNAARQISLDFRMMSAAELLVIARQAIYEDNIAEAVWLAHNHPSPVMLDYLMGHGITQKRLRMDVDDYFERVGPYHRDEAATQERQPELLTCWDCKGYGFMSHGFDFLSVRPSLNQITDLPMVYHDGQVCRACKGTGQTKRKRLVYTGTAQNFYKVQLVSKHDVTRIRFMRGAWRLVWQPCVNVVLHDHRHSWSKTGAGKRLHSKHPTYKGQSIFVLKMFDQRVEGQLSCDLSHSEQDVCKDLAAAIRSTPNQKLFQLERNPVPQWRIIRHIEEAPVDDCRCGICYVMRRDAGRFRAPPKPEPLMARDIIT